MSAGQTYGESVKPAQAWKNFNLGDELGVSGVFIYNGLRRFHEMRVLDHTDEIFEVLYALSVGFERLLKIGVVLLEHEANTDQDALEKSLITHNHLELLRRVRLRSPMSLGEAHIEFLGMLARFYKSLRYDRFQLVSIYDGAKEQRAFCDFLSKYLRINLGDRSGLFATRNENRYRAFLRRIVTRLSNDLYEVVARRASELNLYTTELRHGSKAEMVFLRKGDIPSEETLWKELLVFFMNTESSSAYLEFLRSIPPLNFDPALTGEYLECFQSDTAAGFVLDELETHYCELANKKERLVMMNLIANPDADFDSDEPEEEDGIG